MRSDVRSKTLRNGMAAMVATLLITLPGASQSAATQATENVIHIFSGPDGINPILGVTFDSAGNLYGVASGGGSSHNGTVYELIPRSNGTWSEKTLLSFDGGPGGSTPVGGVVFDSKGNLYGTTKLGGHNSVGVVYELTPSNSGNWTEIALHNFGSSGDGAYPVGNIAIDSNGNIFGTTEGGGAFGNGTEVQGGTVFELSLNAGIWKEKVLHSFGGGSDGDVPKAGVILDTHGNAYGTTYAGGPYGQGTVFEISTAGGALKIIHGFNPGALKGDAAHPATGVTLDSQGNLYGGSTRGFDPVQFEGGGIVYKLSPQTGGGWKETLLFALGHDEFSDPIYSNLVLDSAGHLYGTALEWGGGRLFKTTPVTGTHVTWNFINLFSGTAGARPAVGSLAIDSAGKLYGATQAGGSNKDGVVFSITP
jgi:uncharacterized repeat protein (TIGR03803 family)